MKRRRQLTQAEIDFFAGFTTSDTPGQIRSRKALRLAQEIRNFTPGLPGEVQDQLHNAAFALEEWAEKQK